MSEIIKYNPDVKAVEVDYGPKKPVSQTGVEMSVAGVANSLSVSDRTIRRYVKKLYPDKVENGKITLLNEAEVTKVKLELQKAKNLDTVDQLPKTDLEKELIIQQAMSFQAEKIGKLQNENDRLNYELKEAQPKIEFHDQVGDSEGLYNIGEVAKMLNLGYGRNTFFKNLREMKIFFNTEPYQKYINQGYFQVKSTTKNDHTQKQAFVTGKGMQWLQKRFNSKSPLQLIF